MVVGYSEEPILYIFKETSENKSIYESNLEQVEDFNQNNLEEYNEVLKEIHSLKEPQRQIMILRLINDFTFKEIGEILGKSENYCRVNFFREKKKLVKQFND